MNFIDFLIIFVLTFAAYCGVREGLIVQIFSIAGMFLSIWAGSKYSSAAADMLHIEGDYSKLLGFLVATIVALIVIAIAGRLVRGFFKFVGVGSIDMLLGALLSVCKFLLILSLCFTAINMANNEYNIFDKSAINESKLYMPIAKLSNHLAPVWGWVNEQVINE